MLYVVWARFMFINSLVADDYILLGKSETAMMAKTGLLVAELHRFYVAVPMMAWKPARVLVFHVK